MAARRAVWRRRRKRRAVAVAAAWCIYLFIYLGRSDRICHMGMRSNNGNIPNTIASSWLVAAVFGGERVKNFSPKKVHAEKGGHVGEKKWEEVEGKCLLVRG